MLLSTYTNYFQLNANVLQPARQHGLFERLAGAHALRLAAGPRRRGRGARGEGEEWGEGMGGGYAPFWHAEGSDEYKDEAEARFPSFLSGYSTRRPLRALAGAGEPRAAGLYR